MLSIKDKRIIQLIIEHCLTIEKVINNLSEDSFEKKKVLQNSVCFDILQIGELAKSLSDEFISEYKEVPWKDIKGMRDWVAHGYHSIRLSSVWKTAKFDILPLRKYCEGIVFKP